jgi:hypothetical protein
MTNTLTSNLLDYTDIHVHSACRNKKKFIPNEINCHWYWLIFDNESMNTKMTWFVKHAFSILRKIINNFYCYFSTVMADSHKVTSHKTFEQVSADVSFSFHHFYLIIRLEWLNRLGKELQRQRSHKEPMIPTGWLAPINSWTMIDKSSQINRCLRLHYNK